MASRSFSRSAPTKGLLRFPVTLAVRRRLWAVRLHSPSQCSDRTFLSRWRPSRVRRGPGYSTGYSPTAATSPQKPWNCRHLTSAGRGSSIPPSSTNIRSIDVWGCLLSFAKVRSPLAVRAIFGSGSSATVRGHPAAFLVCCSTGYSPTSSCRERGPAWWIRAGLDWRESQRCSHRGTAWCRSTPTSS